MENSKTIEDIKVYYNSDNWVKQKLLEYINGNKRVDRCLDFFSDVVEGNPEIRNILEIGCSIGLTTVELAYKYPSLKFVGVDIAEKQIEFAKNNFKAKNSTFICSDIINEDIGRRFDLITLFDVYEHIKIDKRLDFNMALSRLLTTNGTLLITCPSWLISERNRQDKPEVLQIVDEIVSPSIYQQIADDIGGTLIYLNLISIWERFDYCQCIITREKPLKKKINHRRSVSFLEKIKIKLGLDKRQKEIKRRKKIVEKANFKLV